MVDDEEPLRRSPQVWITLQEVDKRSFVKSEPFAAKNIRLAPGLDIMQCCTMLVLF